MVNQTFQKTILKSDVEGSLHSYSHEEKKSIVEHINSLLQNDSQLSSIIPINPNSEDIFEVVKDGILLW